MAHPVDIIKMVTNEFIQSRIFAYRKAAKLLYNNFISETFFLVKNSISALFIFIVIRFILNTFHCILEGIFPDSGTSRLWFIWTMKGISHNNSWVKIQFIIVLLYEEVGHNLSLIGENPGPWGTHNSKDYEQPIYSSLTYRDYMSVCSELVPFGVLLHFLG